MEGIIKAGNQAEMQLTEYKILKASIEAPKTITIQLGASKDVPNKLNLKEVKTLKASISKSGNIAISMNPELGLKTILSKSSDFLKGSLNKKYSLTGSFSLPVMQSSVEDIYYGPYEVTPKSKEQVLYTKDKILNNNVSVKKIPYYETSNLTGKTIYIGGE